MKNILKNAYNVIFHPGRTFAEMRCEPSMTSAIVTLIFVSFFVFTLKFNFNADTTTVFNYIFWASFTISFTIISWLLLGGFFEFVAKIFERSGFYKEFLCLSAFATTPWIFLAPLNILKSVGGIGYLFSVLLELFLYFWIIFLFVKALQVAYNLQFSRVIMLIFLPFVGSFFALAWTIGFFSKIVYMFKI